MGVAGILDARLRVREALVIAPLAAREIPPRHRVESAEIHLRHAPAFRAFDLALDVGFALDHNVLDQVIAGGALVVVEDGHIVVSRFMFSYI